MNEAPRCPVYGYQLRNEGRDRPITLLEDRGRCWGPEGVLEGGKLPSEEAYYRCGRALRLFGALDIEPEHFWARLDLLPDGRYAALDMRPDAEGEFNGVYRLAIEGSRL